jgi:hypothetical protein
MKYIYQVVTTDCNGIVQTVDVNGFFATKELAKKDIEKTLLNTNSTVEDWNLHPYQHCEMKQGTNMETWTTYEVVKVVKRADREIRYGIITHKLHE